MPANSEPPLPPLPVGERDRLAHEKVGAVVKGWRLTRLLGAGPVSAAYESSRGHGDAAERAVVRLMMGNIAKHEHARAHFLRGAYAANRFNHPRVLPVSGDGTDTDGAPFVVRTWVDSEPLSQIVTTKGALPEQEALRIAEQLLDALEIAHAHGIVHGAISPSNVLVTPRGSIRLVDFAVPPGLGPRTTDEQEVLASRRMGPFSAPERCGADPEAASEASDVYSVVAVMYFALARRAPRGDASTGEQLARTAVKPLREAAPEVGESLAAIVDYALQLDPGRRYESAYAMLGDVRRVLAGRKPKLGEAHKPNPSGSFSGMGIPASSRRISNNPPISMAMGPESKPPPTIVREQMRRQEWKGNVVLILAIAVLVGVATFVMVREKVDEERQEHGGANHPADTTQTTTSRDGR